MSDKKTDKLLKKLEYMISGLRSEIPTRFHRTFEDELFSNRDLCSQSLLIGDTRYQIGKHYRENSLVQELAVCFDCRDRLRKGYSKESEERMSALFSQELMHKRLISVSEIEGNRLEKMTENCLLCERSKDDAVEYFECAICVAEKFIFCFHPYMIWDQCIIAMLDSLSKATKEMRNRFVGEYFGIPPGWLTKQEYELVRKMI